jgi:hypothetical protein
MKKPRPLSTIGPRAFTCSTLSPLPKQFRDQELRATVAGYALALFGAGLLLVAVLALMGCSKPPKYDYICARQMIDTDDELFAIGYADGSEAHPMPGGSWACAHLEFGR